MKEPSRASQGKEGETTMDDLHVEEYNGYRIRIVADAYDNDPREDYDNLGTIGHWHRRYNLGELDFRKENIQPHEHVAKIEKQGGIVLPLALLDHSGLHIYIGDGPHWSDSQGWDSGHVGYIWVEAAKIRKEYGRITKEVRDRATSVLQDEVALLDLALRGGFVGRIIERIADNEEVDSVYGYTPDYDEKAGMYGYTYNDLLEEGRRLVDYRVEKETT
jgi:hypothetical protein